MHTRRYFTHVHSTTGIEPRGQHADWTAAAVTTVALTLSHTYTMSRSETHLSYLRFFRFIRNLESFMFWGWVQKYWVDFQDLNRRREEKHQGRKRKKVHAFFRVLWGRVPQKGPFFYGVLFFTAHVLLLKVNCLTPRLGFQPTQQTSRIPSKKYNNNRTCLIASIMIAGYPYETVEVSVQGFWCCRGRVQWAMTKGNERRYRMVGEGAGVRSSVL